MLVLIVPALVASLLLGSTGAGSQVAVMGSDTDAAKAESLVTACKTAFNNNDLKTALADCNKAIALDPSAASVYALRGDVKDTMGDHHGALADYDQAIKLNPNYEYGYATRCDTKRELKDYAGAAADCQQATQLDPTDAYAFDRFGRLDLDQDHYDAAVDHYTSAIGNDSERASSFAGRCEAYVELEKYALAFDDCQKALDINPNNDDGLFYLATAEHNLGRSADAVKHWNTYIARYPDDSVPYYNRGLALIDTNDLQAALKDFSTYIERQPRDGDGFYKRAVVENKLGSQAAALSDLKTALKLYQIAGDDAGAKKASALTAEIGGH